MPIKLIQVETDQSIPAINGVDGYSDVWALVRCHGHAIGYARIHVSGGKVTSDELAAAIVDQCGDAVLRHELCSRLMPEEKRDSMEPPCEPFVSVLVCTRDRAESLRITLDSLAKLDYPKYEVLVVDNCPSNNATKELVAGYPFRYVVEPRAGHSWVRNRAILESGGEVVAFIDDDMTADPGWLRAIADGFANPKVMCVTDLVLPSELETEAQELFEIGYGGYSQGFERKIFQPGVSERPDLWHWLGCGMGIYSAFRKAVFSEIGMFDIALGGAVGGAEDEDILHRLVQAGYAVLYNPAAIRFHRHRPDYDGMLNQIQGYSRSFVAFLTKCFLYDREYRTRLTFFTAKHCWHYLFKRYVGKVRGRETVPLTMMIAESIGIFQGPWAYIKSVRSVRGLKETT